MAKISVYINDRASGTSKLDWEYELHKFLFRHDVSYYSPFDLESLKAQLTTDLYNGTEYIFSIGGDGTANLITQFLALSDIKLMVIPTGTANDFASELGTNEDIKKIIQIFRHQTSKKIDLIKINESYMFSNGGIGLAANVALKVNKYRKRVSLFKQVMKKMGANTYSMILGKELFLKPINIYKLRIHSPDFPLFDDVVETPMLLINNQSKVGGKFNIAPNTTNDDGKFNVSILLHKNKRDLFQFIFKTLMDQPDTADPNFITFETNQISITNESEEILPFFGDGEVLEKAQSFDIRLLKQAINVCAYQDHLMYSNRYSLDEVTLS